MKKYVMPFAAALCLFSQSVLAAPSGLYDLTATWTDGQFSGQFQYDATAPFHITSIKGRLVDALQSTSIDKITNPDLGDPDAAPASFFSNTRLELAEFAGHDAGFYLTLQDLGASLALDLAGANGLFDWSGVDETRYISDSALVSFSIAQASAADVPEPATAWLLFSGMAGMLALSACTSRVRTRRA
jgi:hypothetical protein